MVSKRIGPKQADSDAVSKIHKMIEGNSMTNQILVIKPYWHLGTWVFDDPTTDLVQEPLVSGVPEMINDLVKDIANARQGFRMLFSSAPFPGFQRKLEWVRTEVWRQLVSDRCATDGRLAVSGNVSLLQ